MAERQREIPEEDYAISKSAPNRRFRAPALSYRPPRSKKFRPRIGIIGCGGIVPTHLKAYRKARYRVVALTDPLGERAEEKRDQFYPQGPSLPIGRGTSRSNGYRRCRYRHAPGGPPRSGGGSDSVGQACVEPKAIRRRFGCRAPTGCRRSAQRAQAGGQPERAMGAPCQLRSTSHFRWADRRGNECRRSGSLGS